MSSRALKRLQEQQQQHENVLEGDDSFSEEDQSIAPRIQKRNVFEVLNQDDESENENDEENQCDTEQGQAEDVSELMAAEAAKSQKDKKNKQKRKNKRPTASKLDNKQQKNNKEPREDEFALPAINPQEGACGGKPTFASTIKQVLAIDLRHLDPKNEMRRIFGKDLLKEEMKRLGQNACIKPTVMVTPHATWPFLDKNHITMKLLNAKSNGKATSPNSIKWFAFEHNEAYRTLQAAFLTALESVNFDFMVDTVERFYHLHTLIYMSDLCRIKEHSAKAAEMIERGLLAMETALHPSFSYTDGNCRLSYRCRENRPFFLLLFKHAQCLEGRALCRTALEVAKFLLNLNPEEDPLGMVLIMDYYALRSNEYEWLINFYEKLEGSRKLAQLPNMVFSYALAVFLLEGDNEKAETALQNAILTFPALLQPLLTEIGVNVDGYVANHPYLLSSVSLHQTAALNQLVCMYVCRAKHIWRPSSAVKWLERNVHVVLKAIDKDKSLLNFYDDERSYCVVKPPVEVLRHIILGDFQGRVPISQFLLAHRSPLLHYDPLPPNDTNDSYDSSKTSTESRNPFTMFINSFLPSFNTTDGVIETPQAEVNLDEAVDELERRLEELNREMENDDAEAAVGSSQPSNSRMPEDNTD